MIEIQQALIFKSEDRLYAVDSDEVLHILRVPKITKLPLVDRSICGICPIEGSVVAIFDCRFLLNRRDFVDSSNDKARLISFSVGGCSYALLVEEVLSSIDIDQKNLEESKEGIEAVYKEDDRLIQILSINSLLSKVKNLDLLKEEIGDISSLSKKEILSEGEVVKYLYFKIGREKFALKADSIREIISNNSKITKIADSSEYILGMLTIRGEVIIAIDLAAIFEMDSKFSSSSRIIILREGEMTLGLLVDEILDIKDVATNSVEMLPSRFHKNRLSGVIKEGKDLISTIDNRFVESLFEESGKFLQKEEREKISSKQEDLCEMVTFKIGDEEYGFLIDVVEEIIRYEDITEIPNTPKLFKGVINLRGKVVPVISLYQRLGAVEKIGENSKILVCKSEKSEVGFLVDLVDEVLSVDEENIKDANNKEKIVEKIVLANGGKRVVLILDIDAILALEEVNSFEPIEEGLK